MVGADELTRLDGPWEGLAGVGAFINAIGLGPTATFAAWPRRIGGR